MERHVHKPQSTEAFQAGQPSVQRCVSRRAWVRVGACGCVWVRVGACGCACVGVGGWMWVWVAGWAWVGGGLYLVEVAGWNLVEVAVGIENGKGGSTPSTDRHTPDHSAKHRTNLTWACVPRPPIIRRKISRILPDLPINSILVPIEDRRFETEDLKIRAPQRQHDCKEVRW